MSIFITTSMVLLSSTVAMVAWNSKEARACVRRVVRRGWARFARHGEHRRRARWQQGPQARLGGHTARSEAEAAPGSQDQLRSLAAAPASRQQERDATRGSRVSVSVLRRRIGGTLLAFGDHSAALA
jgi:hypothetical protein